jgi:hypothetical protein
VEDDCVNKRHRKLIAVGAVILVVAWLAWMFLLTDTELPPPVPQ